MSILLILTDEDFFNKSIDSNAKRFGNDFYGCENGIQQSFASEIKEQCCKMLRFTDMKSEYCGLYVYFTRN